MNLTRRAKRDPKKESEGVWRTFMGDARFQVRSTNIPEFRERQQELHELYRSQIAAGGATRVVALFEIGKTLCAEILCANWENLAEDKVDENGETVRDERGRPVEVEVPFSVDNALRIFSEYPDCVGFIRQVAEELEPYLLRDDPITSKN